MPPTKVGWQSSPKVRGTQDLLFSCATTLFLCAWTAYHPNIPTGRRKTSRLAHRFVWMLIAVVAPEFVLWCAWEQLWTARKLRKSVNAILSQEHTEMSSNEDEECYICKEKQEQQVQSASTEVVPADGNAEAECENLEEVLEVSVSRTDSSASVLQEQTTEMKKGEPWNLEQAFFALAGGYALPSTDPSLPPITLTANGVLLLIQLGVLPSTPPSAISDKSKADAFAKALVCFQAGWFIVQLIGRASAKLPITTLEIHVLAHVLCAFAIYAVWFEKGYDVGDPIIVNSEEGQALGVLFEMEGIQSSDDRYMTKKVVKCACTSPHIDASTISPCPRPTIRHSSAVYWKWLFSQLTKYPVTRTRTRKCPDDEGSYHVARVERANYALRLLKEHDVHMTYTEEPMSENDTTRAYVVVKQGYTVPLCSNLTIKGLGADIKESRSGFREKQSNTYALIAFFYGAVHLFAIVPSHFPTRIEYYFWLSATIVMMAIPLVTMLTVYDPSPKFLNKMHHTTPKNFAVKALNMVVEVILDSISMVLMMLTVLGWSCYPVARLYVLVESLVGLRSVDGQVYQTVQWAQWMPHVG